MKKAIIIVAATMLLASPALAERPGFGPRIGYTSTGSIDQVHLGGHVEVRNIASNVHLVPSIEIGTGDGTLLALNGDIVYDATELASRKWGFYGGGGPALTRYEHRGHDKTDFALSLVAGTTYELRHDRALFGEVRVGIEDAPDLKLTLGLTFR